MENIALIFAGGTGTRMGLAETPKQFLQIYGKPVIIHTLERFQQHPDIAAIAVVILAERKKQLQQLIHHHHISKVRWIVTGGDTGQDSRYRGLRAIADDPEINPAEVNVLIHDGVRPLINDELISNNISAATDHGSAVTCTKVHETVVESDTGMIETVLPREHLWTAQAPQTFRLSTATEVYERAIADGLVDTIDTSFLFRHYGLPVHRVPGPRTNIKITTISDYYIARTFLTLREDEEAFGRSNTLG